MAAADGGGTQQLTLEPQHELRMEVDWGKQVHLQGRTLLLHLASCAAGVGPGRGVWHALDLGERVTIGGQKIADFSWEGCTLQLDGEPDMMYTSDETPMGQYVNIHDVLDARRKEALKAKGEGPRTFVVGPQRCLPPPPAAADVGKSTLCKILFKLCCARRLGPPPLLTWTSGRAASPCQAASPPRQWKAPIDIEDGLPV
ncbi:hypothetical protein ABPG77_007059 [Micractinium sp. CCAP 211/92]